MAGIPIKRTLFIFIVFGQCTQIMIVNSLAADKIIDIRHQSWRQCRRIEKCLAVIGQNSYRAGFQGVEMKLELKRISLWATVKISFLLNLVFGFVVGCFYGMIFAMIAAIPSPGLEDSPLSQISGVFALMLPFIMAFGLAVFNTIFAVIMLLVYNLAARMMGGMEFEFAKVDEQVAVMTPSIPIPPPAPAPPPVAEPPQSPFSPYSQKPNDPPEDSTV